MSKCTTPITVVIGSTALEDIVARSLSHAPAEACGILIGVRRAGTWRIEQVVESPNVTRGDPTASYQLDSALVVEHLFGAPRTGRSILGFYHSHPHGPTEPSARDRELAWPGKSYLIVSVAEAGMTTTRCWRLPAGCAHFVEDRLVIE